MEPLGEQAEEIIKDPYIFDFVPAAKKLKEIELENALVQQITKLLLEFGSGFAFMGHQYPITVGSKDFFKVECIEGGMTQAQLAERIKTTSPYVNRIIKKQEGVVNKTFVQMLEALGYDVELTYVKQED